MDSITQDMKFRLSLIKYAEKYGVTRAAIKYKTNRQYIYRWKRRFDGSIESLRNKSRRPHHHPNQHTEQEIKLINDMRKRNMHEGLVVFWVKLRQRGYTRSIPGLYRFLKKQQLMAVKLPNPKYVPKPYEQMSYPGQRVQVDVKHVPAVCLVGDANGEKFYQYTAIDEFSRFRYVEAFNEASTYTSALFVKNLTKAFKLRLNASKPIMALNLPNALKVISLHYLKKLFLNLVLNISSLDLLHQDIMVKLNAVIAKITKGSMLLELSTLLMISLNN